MIFKKMQTFLNGQFVASDQANISVADHGFLFGDGVYDTLRTFSGKLYRPERHIQRLFKAMEAVAISPIWSEEEILAWIKEGIEKNGFSETRVRITVTRGANKFRVNEVAQPTLLITFTELQELAAEYVDGVKVISDQAERALPQVKTISMAPVMRSRSKMEQVDAFEVLLVNRDGFVTEGSVTNVFMIEDGEILTPGDGMLEGTTRGLVLEWIEGKWPVRIENISVEDLRLADEVFLTNAVKGIVPVVEIDGKIVGSGKPGEVTQELVEKWKGFVKGNF